MKGYAVDVRVLVSAEDAEQAKVAAEALVRFGVQGGIAYPVAVHKVYDGKGEHADA